jgi:23S rRNA (cytidine1920-2'-O)/16S rRNA (cytidine1409-2'-O)-methyltransferase
MSKRRRTVRRELEQHLRRVRPDFADPRGAIVAGVVWVDGRIVTNPRSLVALDAAIIVREAGPLRGEAKLAAAIATFDVTVDGRVAVDLGAAAGGFTRVLLAVGARRVYAVDVGHGQLLGSLRRDARVVNLEATNLADLDVRLVPDVVELVTFDLSYLSLAAALPQLGRLFFAPDADLVALVKPTFELALPRPPTDPALLDAALAHARRGVEAAGWTPVSDAPSPVLGARGARELLLHARRRR